MNQIEFIPLQLVDDYDKNSNTHPQAQIENIKALMLYVGWTVPALVRKTGERYGLIAGHGRREAANELQGKSLKMADGTPIPAGCIPVLFADGWSDEQIRAYVIADNQVPRQSVFDESILAEELQALQDGGLDLGMIGFGEGELERLLASIEPEPEYQTDPDDAPEVDEESTPVSVRGMVWLCGNHRVMCGSSTCEEDVSVLMNGGVANMCFTDPPYLMDFSGGINTDGSKSFNSSHGSIKNDKMSKADGEDFLDAINRAILKNVDGAFYITFYRLGIDWYFSSMSRVGMRWRSLIVWDKGNHTLSNSDYMSTYEPMFYGWVNKHKFYGGKNGMDIWRISRTKKNDLHPTMKPVELADKAIIDGSQVNGVVVDFFGGSGTTLIASEKNNRQARIMELDPKYCDVIVKRWQQFTGKDATLENDGRTFNEIASLCQ